MNAGDTITIPRCEYQQIQQLQSTIAQLQGELSWLKRQIFGQKSERFIPADEQTSLDLGVEEQKNEIAEEKISYTRRKPRTGEGHGRGPMPTHLPFDDVIIEPDEDVSGCVHIGDEISWEYEYTPGNLFVRRYIRRKYARPRDEGVACGSLPPRPVEKGNFGPGIMSAVVTDKYLYHLPLHRQRQKYRNQFGVDFSESTFCDLVTRSVFWLEAVYAVQKRDLLAADYLQVDETPIPVLIKVNKRKTHRGYYWVYSDPLRKNVVFEYRSGRGRDGPNTFLRDFRGIIQTDGYTGYNELASRKGIVRAACMAHVRRKFEAALEYDRTAAGYALGTIGGWFEKEREAVENDLEHEQRAALRRDHLCREFDAFKKWMEQQAFERLPKDPIRKACEYGLGQWEGFDVYLQDGRVELSNNRVENAIRPVALGRKNYLFKGSHAAAQRGAIIYSLVATAKLHGKDPFAYVKHLLESLPAESASNIERYLPYAKG